MYCLRSYLPLLLLPLPLSLSPIHLILLLALTYILNRPCIYCSFLLIILFASSCHWSNRCFIDFARPSGNETLSLASWSVPRLYTAMGADLVDGQTSNATDMSRFLADIAGSTVSTISEAVVDTAASVLDEARRRISTNMSASASSMDAGIGTYWLRQLIGRSEWTLPCVGVKVVL